MHHECLPWRSRTEGEQFELVDDRLVGRARTPAHDALGFDAVTIPDWRVDEPRGDGPCFERFELIRCIHLPQNEVGRVQISGYAVG